MTDKYPALRHASSPEEIRDLFVEAFGSNYVEKASKLFHVRHVTIKKWLRGNPRPPTAVLLVLHILANGLEYLPGAGAEWNKWIFQDGVLIDRDDRDDKHGQHTPGSIRTYWWTKQEITELKSRENKQAIQIEESEATNVVSLKTVRSNIGNILFHRLYKKLKELKHHV